VPRAWSPRGMRRAVLPSSLQVDADSAVKCERGEGSYRSVLYASLVSINLTPAIRRAQAARASSVGRKDLHWAAKNALIGNRTGYIPRPPAAPSLPARLASK
jgi:hypothetical protein